MTMPDPSAEPTYGRYETLFRIASGGMAEVYAARARGEAGFEKLVALKRMLPHLSGDERFVTMFMDEARLAANIASPHVVSTLDLGRASDGSLYLVMELVVGVTLHSLVRNVLRSGASLPIPVAVEMLAQAAQGLHDAHEACTPTGSSLEIVHRDVSPQNILVGVDGRARLTDFGIARATERSTQTSTGEFKGKFAYSSPEQCANEALDRRADVFSLAIVGWEILTGERLFYADTPLGILEKVTRLPIPEAVDVRPEIPRAISDVIAKGLRRPRDERFATAGELERALREAARATGNVASPAAVAELVRAHGGEALTKMESRLRASLAAPSPGSLSGPPITASSPGTGSGVTRSRPGGSHPGGSRPGGSHPGSRPGGSYPGGSHPGSRPGGSYPGGSHPGSRPGGSYPGSRPGGPPPPPRVPPSTYDAPTVVTPPPEVVLQPPTAETAPKPRLELVVAPEESHVGTPPGAAAAPPGPKRAALSVAVAVVLVAACVAGWLALQGSRPDQPAPSTIAAPASPAPSGIEATAAPPSAPAEATSPAAPPVDVGHEPNAPADAPAAARERRGSRRARHEERRTEERRTEERRASARDEQPATPSPQAPASPPRTAATAPSTPPRTAERPAAPAEPAPQAPASRPRGSGLLSIDAFERDLGGN